MEGYISTADPSQEEGEGPLKLLTTLFLIGVLGGILWFLRSGDGKIRGPAADSPREQTVSSHQSSRSGSQPDRSLAQFGLFGAWPDLDPRFRKLITRLESNLIDWHAENDDLKNTLELHAAFTAFAESQVNDLTLNQIEEIIRFIERPLVAAEISDLWQALYIRWGALAPQAALDHLFTANPGEQSDSYHSLMVGWASVDAPAAWKRWLADAKSPDPKVAEVPWPGTSENLFRFFAQQAPNLAEEQLAEIPSWWTFVPAQAGFFQGLRNGQDWKGFADRHVARIKDQEGGRVSDWSIRDLAVRWMDDDPRAALAWAREHVEHHIHCEPKPLYVEGELLSHWYEHNTKAAESWISNQALKGNAKLVGAYLFEGAIQVEDVVSFVSVLRHLPDAQKRGRILEVLARKGIPRENASGAADPWVDPFDPESRLGGHLGTADVRALLKLVDVPGTSRARIETILKERREPEPFSDF